MTEWLAHLLVAIGAYAVITTVQIALRKRYRLLACAGVPLNIFLLCAIAELLVSRHLAVGSQVTTMLRQVIRAAFLIASGYLGTCLVDVLLFGLVVPRQIHRPVPVVLRSLFRVLMLAVAIFVVLRAVFPNLNFSVLAVSSIVVGYILGNASQDTLGNLFAGLALNAERPFAIGDWIQVGTHTGQVVDMTWRATWLRTKNNDQVIVPNSTMARETVVNYSRPTPVHAVVTKIGVSYDSPPTKVREVVTRALGSIPEILADPPPRVWLHEYSEFTMNFTVKFFITDFEHREDILSRAFDRIWYHFKREGILIPFPIRVQWTRDSLLARNEAARAAFQEECRSALETIAIFQPLSPEERATVLGELQEKIYAAEETLVREGDEGTSFYLILTGTTRVSVKNREGQEVTIAHLGPGGFFGEMSLLTGEKRSATVTAETDTRVAVLPHGTLKALLERNPSLADQFARVLVKRSQEQAAARQAVSEAEPIPPSSHHELLTRILSFFGLGSPRGTEKAR